MIVTARRGGCRSWPIIIRLLRVVGGKRCTCADKCHDVAHWYVSAGPEGRHDHADLQASHEITHKRLAKEHLVPGQTFNKSAPVQWFAEHYPKIKRNMVTMHVEGMSTNNQTGSTTRASSLGAVTTCSTSSAPISIGCGSPTAIPRHYTKKAWTRARR
jgi:hypothetical protein